MEELLKVQDLAVQFNTLAGTIHAVNGVSFSLKESEVICIVGESGCGKSVSVMSLLGLLPPTAKITGGQALFHGCDLFSLREKEKEAIRGAKIGMIFQDPMTSLNPVLTIEYQITEMLLLHRKMTKKEARQRCIEMLQLVGIPEPETRLKYYPFQFSGGMRQRAMIAMALACNPQILIADEPTTALDVTIQAQIIDLVKRLCDDLGMAIIWITHDLGVAAGLADRVLVMYAGQIIEEAETEELFGNPQHPYTIGLLNALPRIDASEKKRLQSIEGVPPVLYGSPETCPFASRCYRIKGNSPCKTPHLFEVSVGHHVACWIDPQTGRIRE